jgi:hypothetical protein
MGHTVLQSYQKTSPFFTLLLDIQPFFHCGSHILSALIFLPTKNLPDKESPNAEIFD